MKKKWIFTGITAALGLILALWIQTVGDGTNGFGLKALKASAGEQAATPYQYNYEIDPEDRTFRDLEVDWVYGDVEIRLTDSGRIRLTERADRALEEDGVLEYSLSGGTLEVKWNDTFTFLGRFSDYHKNLLIELPRQYGQALETVTCKTLTGNIQVSGLAAETGSFSNRTGQLHLENVRFAESLKASSSSGLVFAENLTAGEVAVETVTAPADIRGQAEKLAVKTISGEVFARLTNTPEEAALESVSGDIYLSLPQDAGFTVEYASVSGSISAKDFAQNEKISQRSGQIIVGSGEAQFELTTTSGEMSITGS